MLRRTVMGLSVAFLLAPNAMASNYPTEAFDAKYSISSGYSGKNMTSEMRMASDGKGHMLTETSAAGQKFGTIVDYLQKTSISLIPQGKMAMKSKLPPDGGFVADAESVKQMNGKSLGQKTINGHPCHGFEYESKSGKTETWIGDDCKIVVQSITTSSAGKSIMNLQSIAGKPSDDAFKVPTGYKIMGQ